MPPNNSPICAFVAPVYFSADIQAVEKAHDLAKVSVRCLNDQAVMCCHKDVRVEKEAIFRLPFSNVFLEFLLVPLRNKYLTPFISSRCYVVDCTLLFYPQWPRHFLPPSLFTDRVYHILPISRVDPYLLGPLQVAAPLLGFILPSSYFLLLHLLLTHLILVVTFNL